MRDFHGLVQRAADSRRLLAERHDAFSELVKGFQDIAFAYAYGVLGDFYLAEDAAQEAFITVWQRLGQLRQPEAFPGWLRRIVLTQCNRMTRGKRLMIVPLEMGEKKQAASPDPHTVAEQREFQRLVTAAIKALPPSERQVVTLFYINEYTQADIGEFLQVPISTVNKRLYTARQRLKESAVVEMFKDNLRQRRPSRDESFAGKVEARLRPFIEKDWTSISTITPATEPSDHEGHELWLRNRQEFNESSYIRRHYVAEHSETGELLGYGSIEQTVFLPKYRLILVIAPEWLRRGVGRLLLDQLMNDLREVGAVTVTFRDYESSSSSEVQSFLKEYGFTETMRLLDLRLAVAEADLSPFHDLTERVKALGITISTLREERQREPRYVEKLYELTTTLKEDDPARDFFQPPSYYEREARLWLKRPYVIEDAYFIAKDGEDYIGVTDLNLLEAIPGGLSAGFTGVRREYRRRGIATSLKARAIEYAQEHGFRTIRAFNRPEHSALLALNKRLGFRHPYSHVTLEKCLREVVEIKPAVYDNYSGHYRDERRPELLFDVKKEEGRLTLECIGQKVELFPTSEASFFTKPFYGEFTFIVDGDGRVTHLDSRVRGLNQPETYLHAKKIE